MAGVDAGGVKIEHEGWLDTGRAPWLVGRSSEVDHTPREARSPGLLRIDDLVQGPDLMIVFARTGLGNETSCCSWTFSMGGIGAFLRAAQQGGLR